MDHSIRCSMQCFRARWFCQNSFLAWGYAVWCAISLPAGVRQEFVQGAGDSSPTLCKGHRGNYWDPQRPPSNAGRRDTSLTSIRGTAHPLMNYPARETPGWQFIAVSGCEPRLYSFEASARTSRPSSQLRSIYWR